ncbi:MAG: Ig-like domain-containing protein [Kofleriaceae bacterium]
MLPRPTGLVVPLSSVIIAIAAAAHAAPPALVVAAGPEGRATARQALPDAPAAAASSSAGLAQSRVIFLNREGATVTPSSTNDARTNRSTIASKLTALPGWSAEPQIWDATVACLRDMFAPFAVELVTADPGAVPHLEAIFGGRSSQLGLPANIVGISPFTTSCSTIENSIVYVFTGDLAPVPQVVCEIAAQEIAHSYGLDHELLAGDPMTYLSFSGKRRFLDVDARCGETVARPCGINGSTCRATQNSFQLLRERLGVADAVPPSGTLLTPAEGELVAPDFDIEVAAMDNIAVLSVAFFLDDQPLGERLKPPYALAARGAALGEHTVSIEVTDQARNRVRQSVTVLVEEPATHGLLAACAAGPRTSSATPLLIVAVALVSLRRRRRRR